VIKLTSESAKDGDERKCEEKRQRGMKDHRISMSEKSCSMIGLKYAGGAAERIERRKKI